MQLYWISKLRQFISNYKSFKTSRFLKWINTRFNKNIETKSIQIMRMRPSIKLTFFVKNIKDRQGARELTLITQFYYNDCKPNTEKSGKFENLFPKCCNCVFFFLEDSKIKTTYADFGNTELLIFEIILM